MLLEQVEGVRSSIKAECEDYVILAQTDLKVAVNSKGKLDPNLFVFFNLAGELWNVVCL